MVSDDDDDDDTLEPVGTETKRLMVHSLGLGCGRLHIRVIRE